MTSVTAWGGSTTTPTPEATEGETPTTETTQTETPESGETQKITFWNLGTEDPDKTLWEYGANQYNQDNPDSGYVVEMVATQNDQHKQ